MPQIAKLTPRRQKTWVEISTTDGASLRLPLTHAPGGLHVGAELEAHQWRELSALAEYCELYHRALGMLKRREHFTAELRRKLHVPGVGAQAIERVLAECRRLGYLDDERAAEQLAGQLVTRGGIGRAKLREALFSRGCPAPLAAAAVAAHAAQIDEAEEVARLLQQHRGQFGAKLTSLRRKLAPAVRSERELDMQLRQRLSAAIAAYLAGRGFSGEDIRGAVRDFAAELLGEPD